MILLPSSPAPNWALPAPEGSMGIGGFGEMLNLVLYRVNTLP